MKASDIKKVTKDGSWSKHLHPVGKRFSAKLTRRMLKRMEVEIDRRTK